MAGSTEWLDEGMRVLAEYGSTGLRIERLATRLGVTKGSFYHHFAGMPQYRSDLLAHIERQLTTRYIDSVEQAGATDPHRRLAHLMDLVLAHDETAVEVAVRAWASQDRRAADTQRRTDTIRVDYLRRTLAELGHDGARALEIARTLYLILIGAEHIVPPLSAPEIRRLWERTLEAAEQQAQRPK
ncbi:TetR/AcrR family transcriptional regulator [Nocardia cyriacigeorgica]|uniref:TetR/AcrR family transcriptional regulator n=1 Tax=Nocardia cyriacigeorgica TaxID=135487 RepID=UPI0018942B20|nr:TetR/AcrR family transcriptional regulator [Nocardia cyriacigeorgica]MBF6396684.1 TetR/AcrR family transcriptional regulator [Nocardia cyriacigeorgica]MBF6402316.1 TetR/AcrR family transcriptional regulator [Nocardia cyriacigeorgica]